MCESGYYPMGAEYDPCAPWNEAPLKEVMFNVDVDIFSDEEENAPKKRMLNAVIKISGDLDGYDKYDITCLLDEVVSDELGKNLDYEITNFEVA